MYQPRGWKIQSISNQSKGRKMGREDARAGLSARAAVRGGQQVGVWEENGEERKGKWGFVLDRLSFELDTVITTNSRLRALKLT